MAAVLSFQECHFTLLVLFVVSSLSQEIHATKLLVINHEVCQTCPPSVSSLKDNFTYSELKNDPRAALPSSFTIFVSALVTTDNLSPVLFTILGNDGHPWFSAMITQDSDFVGKQFFYPVTFQYTKIDTMWMFPNQWVRNCLALDTLSGNVVWVARGELVDNTTFARITNKVPTDLTGKVILGALYNTQKEMWQQNSNKLTKVEIFSSALTIEKMIEYTKGDGCGDDGDYLSWNEMQWNLHGGAKVEYMEADETCTTQKFNYYNALLEDLHAIL